MAPERSEGTTKGLRVTKSLSSCRSRRLTYLDYTEQESHDNTFKRHYKRGRASYRFPERKAFDVSMVPTWQLALGVFSMMLTRLTSSRANKPKKTTNSEMKFVALPFI